MTYYSSTKEFTLVEVHKAKDSMKKPQFAQNFECFTNDDYQDLTTLDFRSRRYRKDSIYAPESEDETYFNKVAKKRNLNSGRELPERADGDKNLRVKDFKDFEFKMT